MPTKLKAPGMSSRASSRSKVGTLTNDDLDVIEGNRRKCRPHSAAFRLRQGARGTRAERLDQNTLTRRY